MHETSDRFEKQIRFIIEIDKLKHVFRKTKLFDASRFENDAEHAWHLSLMALVLAEHAHERSIDIAKVVKMALIHDIVEIDADDVIVYDTAARAKAREKEARAADRIFGLLPEDQAKEFRELWEEFEKRESPESKYAAAVDRLEPILQNHLTDYCTWRTHGITGERLMEKNRHIGDGSKTLWEYAQRIFREAETRGALPSSPSSEE